MKRSTKIILAVVLGVIVLLGAFVAFQYYISPTPDSERNNIVDGVELQV